MRFVSFQFLEVRPENPIIFKFFPKVIFFVNLIQTLSKLHSLSLSTDFTARVRKIDFKQLNFPNLESLTLLGFSLAIEEYSKFEKLKFLRVSSAWEEGNISGVARFTRLESLDIQKYHPRWSDTGFFFPPFVLHPLVSFEQVENLKFQT
jgi:hypothetical protein